MSPKEALAAVREVLRRTGSGAWYGPGVKAGRGFPSACLRDAVVALLPLIERADRAETLLASALPFLGYWGIDPKLTSGRLYRRTLAYLRKIKRVPR